MNLGQKIAASKRPWTYLSKVDVWGSFDFLKLVVEFESLDGSHFDRLARLAPGDGFKRAFQGTGLSAEIYQ